MVSEVRIGVVGLGNMGSALVQRLLGIGTEVVVYDVRAEAVDAAVRLGATAASGPSDVGGRSDVVLSSLPGPAIALEVAREVGAGARLHAYVETSTVGPDTVRKIAAELRVPVVDAPLSGGPRGILSGNLTSYVSGPGAVRDQIAAWFDELCPVRIVVGEEPGVAQIAKLVNNAISLSSMAIACEAIAVGVASGVDPKTMVEAVNRGTGRNSATEHKIPASVLSGTFDFGGPVFLAEKDLELYQSLAEETGIRSPLTHSALEAFREAILKFGPHSDYTEIARVFESEVGAEIRHRPVVSGGVNGGGWRSEQLD
ncbi:MAG: NAD(P)-dependent oxidoreductase [Arthrobacter sp.]